MPSEASSAKSPRRRCPNRNSRPTQTSRAARRRTSTFATKASAGVPESAASKRSSPTRSATAQRRCVFSYGVESRGTDARPPKNCRGNGSKLSAIASAPSASARARARASSALWPRCTPSNAPMATTLPRGARHGPSTSRNTKLMKGPSITAPPARQPAPSPLAQIPRPYAEQEQRQRVSQPARRDDPREVRDAPVRRERRPGAHRHPRRDQYGDHHRDRGEHAQQEPRPPRLRRRDPLPPQVSPEQRRVDAPRERGRERDARVRT